MRSVDLHCVLTSKESTLHGVFQEGETLRLCRATRCAVAQHNCNNFKCSTVA